MGFLNWFRAKETVERFEGQRVYRLSPAEAEALQNDGPAPSGISEALCPRCGKVMEDALLATRLSNDPAQARVPSTVADGWVCLACRALVAPRFLDAAQSAVWGGRGADSARVGNFGAAEWWFSRLIGSWGNYPAAHGDLATALLAWSRAPGSSAEDQSALSERRLACLRRAVHLAGREPSRLAPEVAGSLIVSFADAAIEQSSWDEARRALALLQPFEAAPRFAKTIAEIRDFLAGEPEVFRPASARVLPHLHLFNGKAAPITQSNRASLVEAATQLEHHYERHHGWNAIWLAAKTWQALGDRERSLALFRRAEQAHGDVMDVVAEASLACLHAGQHDEAREMNRRAIARMPADSFLWSNLAMCELLCGDVSAARAAVNRSIELEAHPRTAGLQRAIEKWATRGRTPASFDELSATGD